MTEHVRRNYRNHRKATWGFAIALMVAIAVVVIPIASGARQDLHDAVPLDSRRHADAAAEREHDEPDAVFGLDLHREGRDHEHHQLPTARLRGRHVPRERDALQRVVVDGPQLEERQRRLTSAALASEERRGHDYRRSRHRRRRNARAGDHRSRQAIERLQRLRSNPNANGFDNPTFPTIQVQACTATITGRVYHDRDQSGAFAVDPSSPTSDIAKQGWTVTLQRKTGTTTYTNVDSDSSDANGMYSVEGPIGSDFRLCVTAPNPPDSSSRWGTSRRDGGHARRGMCPDHPDERRVTGALRAESARAGATGQDFAVVPITAPNFGAGSSSTAGSYVVTAAGNTTKTPQNYVQETWTDRAATRTSCSRRSTPARVVRQDLPARADVRLAPPERSRADPPGRARLRRHRALPDVHADAVLSPGSSRARGTPCSRPASFRQARPRASSRGIRRCTATVRSRMHRSTSRSSSTRRTTVAGGEPNPAALAVLADALHEALCLLQRVGGIRLTTLQLGKSCEGP